MAILQQDVTDILFDSFDGTGTLGDHTSNTGMNWGAGSRLFTEGGVPKPTRFGGLVDGYLYNPAPANAPMECYTSVDTTRSYEVTFEILMADQPGITIIDFYGPRTNDGTGFNESYYFSFHPDNYDTYFDLFDNVNGIYDTGWVPTVLGPHMLKLVVDATAQTKTLLFDGVQVCQISGGTFDIGQVGFKIDSYGEAEAFKLEALKISSIGAAEEPVEERRMLVL